jgi:hypothetical protein
MGFAWVQLRDAQVAGDVVAIQILATDEKPGASSEAESGTPSDAAPDASPGPSPDASDEELAEDAPPTVPVPAAPRLRI